MTKYALWLMPTGRARDRLATIIEDLSRQYGGPVFEPHVTLLGGMHGEAETLCSKSIDLAQALSSFQVRLTSPGYRGQYFRCVFLNAEPTAALLHAHAQAKKVYGHEEPATFEPHLSLLYGHYPEETKDRIVRSLPQDLLLRFEATTLHLVQATSDNPKDWRILLSTRLGAD